jgi:hypothetical protein
MPNFCGYSGRGNVSSMSNDSDLIYDVPASLAKAYRGKHVKLRTTDPGSIVESLTEKDLDCLISIQIEYLDCDIERLQQSGYALPLELMMTDPVADLSKLYAFSVLVESFPIRACISLAPGFGKAVRVAAALHFAVKLELGQPEASIIPELTDILDFYLHSSGVTEPIEFFHSLLLACYHEHPISLWEIQEEDPLIIRHVDDEGNVSFPGRLVGCDTLPVDPAGYTDCHSCSYLGSCRGYFKWPDHDYDCEGVKELFARIKAAAVQLRTDIAAAEAIAP